VAERVATGVVNARNALLDPRFHWITVANNPQRKVKELQWCRPNVVLKQPDSEDPVADGLFAADRIRQIYLHKVKDSPDEWFFLREPTVQLAATVIATGPGVLMYDGALPLLRVTYDDGSQSETLTLDQIEMLLVAHGGAKVTVKACT